MNFLRNLNFARKNPYFQLYEYIVQNRKFSDVKAFFENHVTAEFMDTSKWNPRGDDDHAEIKRLLTKYDVRVVASQPR